MQAAVEIVAEERATGMDRAILKYRNLFRECPLEELRRITEANRFQECRGFGVLDYFEDEAGRELTYKRMAEVLTGDPKAVMYPGSYSRHDIELSQSTHTDIVDLRPIRLSQS